MTTATATCSECGVRTTYTPVEGNGLPPGWVHAGRNLYCLRCRQVRSFRGLGRGSLLRYYLQKDPSRSDHQIAANAASHGQKLAAVKQVVALRKTLNLPRWKEPEKKPPKAAKPKPEPKKRRNAVAEAKVWLEEYLADGEPHLSTTIHADAERAGYKKRTIDRAGQALDVKRDGNAHTRTWQVPRP